MKAAELSGAQLDYLVAKAERGDTETLRDFEFWRRECWEAGIDRYSTNWQQGGPIIDKMVPCDLFSKSMDYGRRADWYCGIWRNGRREVWPGDSALQAAMRAFVASKFSEEVPAE